MRKVMLLAAMLAMVMVAAAPAFAQAVGGDVNVQVVDCSQVAAVAAQQGQYGDATAVSGDVGSAASASIANELGISVEQVNACLGGINVQEEQAAPAAVEKEVMVEEEAAPAPMAKAAAAAPAAAAAKAAPVSVLPETGGASLMALGAGALLVGGGLLVRRIIR